jgi:hypothetical protein
VNAPCVRRSPVTEAPAPIEIAPTASIPPYTTVPCALENAPPVDDDPKNVDFSERLNAPGQTAAYVPATDKSASRNVATHRESNITIVDNHIIRTILFLTAQHQKHHEYVGY